MPASQSEKAIRFRELHEAPDAFVIANAWDAGSARILAGIGFAALATSGAAAAGVLGRRRRVNPTHPTGCRAAHCLT